MAIGFCYPHFHPVSFRIAPVCILAYPHALTWRSVPQALRGDYEQARAAAVQAVATDPDSSFPAITLIYVELKSGNLIGAQALLKQGRLGVLTQMRGA